MKLFNKIKMAEIMFGDARSVDAEKRIEEFVQKRMAKRTEPMRRLEEAETADDAINALLEVLEEGA